MPEQLPQVSKLAGVLTEHQRWFESLSSEDRQWVINHPKDAIHLLVEAVKNRDTQTNLTLRLLSGGETIIIGKCDGTQTLAQAKGTFFCGIDSDFKNWKLDKPGNATAETAVQVHELIQDATFAKMFGSLGTDLDNLCLTQHQIKTFCAEHPSWLHTKHYATFFLFKKDEQFFVADANMRSGGMFVRPHRLGGAYVWDAACQHRVVVPQLAA